MWWLIDQASAGEGGHEGAHEGASEGGHGGHEGGVPVEELAVQFGSLLIFLMVLIAVARRPVLDALRGRAQDIRKAIDEAEHLKKDAAARYTEIDTKLSMLDRQIADMKAKATAEADGEAARLREKAAADANHIETVATRTIREEMERARQSLRSEAVRLSVNLARDKVTEHLNMDDQRRLAREFLTTIEKEVQ